MLGTRANALIYRSVGRQYIIGSIAPSSQRTYISAFRSWQVFRRSVDKKPVFISSSASADEKIMELVEFAAWCCAAEGNVVGTITGKIGAVKYFHLVHAGVELPTDSILLRRLKDGMKRAHTAAKTKTALRLPITMHELLGQVQ